jgi:hypothetical protein
MAKSAVKTPGEPAGETEADRDVAGAEGLDDNPLEDGRPKTVTITQAQLDEMLQRAVAQGVAMSRAPVAKPVDAELPTQAEVLKGIDQGKIKVPTLSKDGYVVPLNYGEPADPSIKR